MCVCSDEHVPVDVDARPRARAQRRPVGRARVRVLRRGVQHVQQPHHLEEVPAPGAARGQHHGQHPVAVLRHRAIPSRARPQPAAISPAAQHRRSVAFLSRMSEQSITRCTAKPNVSPPGRALDALHRQSGTHYRKLFSVVTLLQFLSLG